MEVSVSGMETARPIFLASTCGILSQDRRHKFIPLDSLLVLHQSHRSVHGLVLAGLLVLFLLHLYTRQAWQDAARACTRTDQTLARFVQSTKAGHASTGVPRFRIIMKKPATMLFAVRRLLDPS